MRHSHKLAHSSANMLIKQSIARNYLEMKYYLVSFNKNLDKKTLVN